MIRIKDSIFSKVHAFDLNEDNKIFFDKELESLFDEKTKKTIKNLFQSIKKLTKKSIINLIFKNQMIIFFIERIQF